MINKLLKSVFLYGLILLNIGHSAECSIFNDLNSNNTTNRVFAHASGAGLTPNGNTLLAAMRSIYYGVDGLELDIRLTKDNVYVLYHDDTVEQYNYSDLQKELVLPWSQTVPKLSDMFELLDSIKKYSNREVDVLFDIKRAEDVEGILNYTHLQNFTNRYGLVSYDFTRDILDNGKRWSKKMGLDIPTMVIITSNVSFGLYNTRLWGYSIASFLYNNLNKTIIEEAKNFVPPINVTCLLVNDKINIEIVNTLGVSGYGTDHPEITYKLKNEEEITSCPINHDFDIEVCEYNSYNEQFISFMMVLFYVICVIITIITIFMNL